MSVKTSIFDSKGEERGFRSIVNTFGEVYLVTPQFPWSGLFNPDPKLKDTSHLFYKTSVDYVVATKAGQPLVAIDFDGMGGGYDKGGQYFQVEPTRDRNRKVKFDWKLRYAQGNGFPYHIVASEEFNHLGEGIDLTQVDCLIAANVCHQMGKIITEENPHLFSDPYEEIDLWGPGCWDIQTGLSPNPVMRKQQEVRRQIEVITGGWFYSMSIRPVSIAPLDLGSWVAVLYNTPVGEVSAVITVRGGEFNFRCELGDVALLLAYSKFLRLLKRRPPQQKAGNGQSDRRTYQG